MKTTRVLDLDVLDEDPDIVYFTATDDTGHATTDLMLTAADYRDLGSPARVTVTIEPGDRLNPPTGPHSRACGIKCAGHGVECSLDCPTCGGRA